MMENNKYIEKVKEIYELTTVVAGDFSLQEVLAKLAEAAVKVVGVKACSIRLLDEKAGDLKMYSTCGLSWDYRNKGVVSKNDQVIKEAFSGEAVIVDDMRNDARVKYPQAAKNDGLVSQLTVAMKFREKAIGVLRLYSPRPKHFNEEDIAVARMVASQCAVAITNARLYAEAIKGTRMAEQLRLAGEIQRRMIPQKAPVMAGLDIAAVYVPCFDVGGDFYDFVQVSDSCIAVVIADVIGKGVPAAIMTSSFRGAVRAYIDAKGPFAIKQIVKKLNKMACDECNDGEFVTMLLSFVDVKNKTITYCNCGHEPAILTRDGKISELNKGGLVLGVEPDVDYEIGKLDLKSEDCLLYYTDGLIDAVDFECRLWGMDRMLEVEKKFINEPAERMVKNILRYRRRFVGLASQVDDTSILVVKVTE